MDKRLGGLNKGEWGEGRRVKFPEDRHVSEGGAAEAGRNGTDLKTLWDRNRKKMVFHSSEKPRKRFLKKKER